MRAFVRRTCLELTLCAVLPGAGAARAATFVVDRLDDVDPDDPAIVLPVTQCADAVPDDCTLRGAVLAANAAGGPDVVQVPAGTYAVVGGGQTTPV
jgi:hypothetical protein